MSHIQWNQGYKGGVEEWWILVVIHVHLPQHPLGEFL
jgi:hypothetical protein